LSELIHNFYYGKSSPTALILLPKEENHPIGENSPNLVTLQILSFGKRKNFCSVKNSQLLGTP
jgi:hypothetical protein